MTNSEKLAKLIEAKIKLIFRVDLHVDVECQPNTIEKSHANIFKYAASDMIDWKFNEMIEGGVIYTKHSFNGGTPCAYIVITKISDEDGITLTEEPDLCIPQLLKYDRDVLNIATLKLCESDEIEEIHNAYDAKMEKTVERLEAEENSKAKAILYRHLDKNLSDFEEINIRSYFGECLSKHEKDIFFDRMAREIPDFTPYNIIERAERELHSSLNVYIS